MNIYIYLYIHLAIYLCLFDIDICLTSIQLSYLAISKRCKHNVEVTRTEKRIDPHPRGGETK